MAASPHLDIRTTDEVLERLDRLAVRLSRPGLEVSRSGAARAAVLRGLEVLEAESIAAEPSAKKGSAPAAKPAKKKPQK